MKLMTQNKTVSACGWALSVIALAYLTMPVFLAAQSSAAKTSASSVTNAATGVSEGVKTFETPQKAADALISAADQFNEDQLVAIFGPNGQDLVFTGEVLQDRQRAADFAAEAKEKMKVSIEPQNGQRAFVLVGNEEWPFPVPIVKKGTQWYFDSNAGRQELVNRRIGANELDAINLCRGFVEAQEEYAEKPHEGYTVSQYAQRVLSSPGKQDGLAWQNADGTWGGPVGEKIAKAIAQGYSSNEEPYHGYFFKMLKGQGPAAPLGQLDYVIEGAMIGGFALVAAPAEYRVTGVKTFIVSNDGVVYEKDLGDSTVQDFKKMELFNPDSTWQVVQE